MKSIDDRRQKLYTVAESQGGYFSAKQALSCGYSHRLQHYHKEKGHWVEIERGCFRLMNYPSSPNEDFIRWSFWSRNRGDIAQAAVSHESALAFHDLGDIVPSKVHLTVPPTFRKKAAGGCVLHRKALPLEALEKHEGFLVTTPLQSIIDAAEGDTSVEQLEQALRDAFQKGLLVPATVTKAEMTPAVRERIEGVMDAIRRKPVL